jgi:RNA polymerase sigma-70 factor (ECF subfamily)
MAAELKLIQRAKTGNRNAFGKLIQNYQDKILYLAYDILGDYEEAKDAAQDIFVKVFKNLESFDQKSEFKTWLYRIALNTCLDILRKRKNMQEIKLNIDVIPEKSADDGKLNLDDTFYSALGTLSEKQYSAIVLKYFHENTTKEIAGILDCEVDTVRTHLHRAVQKIRNFYKQSDKQ